MYQPGAVPSSCKPIAINDQIPSSLISTPVVFSRIVLGTAENTSTAMHIAATNTRTLYHLILSVAHLIMAYIHNATRNIIALPFAIKDNDNANMHFTASLILFFSKKSSSASNAIRAKVTCQILPYTKDAYIMSG